MYNRMFRTALRAATVFTLSACGHYAWQKPGGDPSTFAADNYACKQAAIASAPPAYAWPPPNPYGGYAPYQPYGNTVYQQEETRCKDKGGTVWCKTESSVHGNVSFQPTVPPQDVNAGARDDLFGACMQSRGWVYQWIEDPK
jgi:hypothetical protein